MSPIRFLIRTFGALMWFVRVSIRLLRTSSTETDYDLTHRYAQELSRGFKRILRLHHEIRNAARLDQSRPCIFIANHRSNLDVITMCEILPERTIVIGKREVVSVPMLGTLFVRGGNVPLNRRDSDAAQEAMGETAALLGRENVSVFIFPEGHRNFGKLLPFKKGAFHLARAADVPIVPMVCATTPDWLSPFRLWIAPRTRVLIEVLEPFHPRDYDSIDSMIDFARGKIESALQRVEQEVAAHPSPLPEAAQP